MENVVILPPAAKYFKKIKDKRLKNLYLEAIQKIRDNPEIGEAKTGDLQGIRGYDIYYNKTNYELAYTLEIAENGDVIVVIMAGTRENFYETLKNYLHSK